MRTDAISFDLETHLIQPGLLAPPMVCGSAAEPSTRGALLDKAQTRAVFSAILGDRKYTIVGANIAYDMLIMLVDSARLGADIAPQIFMLYDPGRSIVRGHCEGRVFDVQVAEALHAIAGGHLFKDPFTLKPMDGRYSLDACTQQVLNRTDAKVNDTYRLRYAELEDVPLRDWPFVARQYPIDDAVNTLEVGLAQAGHLPACWTHVWTHGTGDTMSCARCGETLKPETPTQCMSKRPRRNIHELSRQVYAAWAMHLGDSWGFNIDLDAVDALETKYGDTREEDAVPFKAAGILRADGTENQSTLKALVARAYGAYAFCPACKAGKVPSEKTGKPVNCKVCDGSGLELPVEVPRTETDRIGAGRDVLQESGDELLMSYAEFDESAKILSTYIPLLRRARVCVDCGRHGTKKSPHTEECGEATYENPEYRRVPLTLRSNVLVETGRTSYSDGIHGLPRKGGIRECITARPGYLISSEDYTAGELVTLAWACLKMVGYSKLGEALNAGLDAHLALAGTMLGKSYADMLALQAAKDLLAKDNRQAAKAANFGFPGGMAELTFTLRKRSEIDLFTPCENGPDERKGVRGYKGLRTCILMDKAPACGIVKVTEYKKKKCPPVCKACLESAARLREFWFRQWPEMNPRDGYFSKVSEILDQGNGEVVQLRTERVRGNVDFCSGANGFFQGLLADAAKDAFCQIQRECMDTTVRVESSEFMQSKYAGGPSPLLGSRAIILTHDESVCEHPESVAHDAATRASEIMVESLRFKCPEMAKAVKAEPALMRRLYKSAEPTFDASGKLIPWEPT